MLFLIAVKTPVEKDVQIIRHRQMLLNDAFAASFNAGEPEGC
jgi:hypothetical protein